MEENPLSVSQVVVITNIEVLISGFSDNPDVFFDKIIALIDTNKISEHKDIMKYLSGLIERKAHQKYAEEFRKKYDIKTVNP